MKGSNEILPIFKEMSKLVIFSDPLRMVSFYNMEVLKKYQAKDCIHPYLSMK
jgi:hypothetical protein